MAKLPTFEAKKATGGGGGIVQMTPQERSMRKAFRKSTDIKASDIYQQAGDQALAQAIGNMGALANKIAIQRDEADYERRSQKMRQDYVAKMQDLNHRGIDAQQEAEKFLAETKDLYGAGASERTIKRLEKDFNELSLRTRIHAINVTAKESRAINDNSNIELRNFYANEVSAGRMTREDALAKMTSHRVKQEGVYYSKDAIQQHLRNDNTVFVQTEINKMIFSAETPKQIEEAVRYLDLNGGLFSTQDRGALMARAEAKRKEVATDLFIENKSYHQKVHQLAKITGEVDPMYIQNLKDLHPEVADAMMSGLSTALELFDFRQEVSDIDTSNITLAGEKIDELVHLYKTQKVDGLPVLTPEAAREIDMYARNYKQSLEDSYENSNKVHVSQIASKYSRGIAAGIIGDKGFYKNQLIDSVSEKYKSKLIEALNRADKEYEEDPAGARQRYSSLAGDFANARDAVARARTPKEYEAAIIKLGSITKGYIKGLGEAETKLMPDQELEDQIYSRIRTGDPNLILEATHYLNTVYGEFVPRVLFDIGERIAEGDIPKGLSEDKLAAFIASITPALKGRTDDVGRISNSIYDYARTPASDRPDIGEIPTSVSRFAGNDPLYSHKLFAYKALRSTVKEGEKYYTHEEALEIAFREQSLINGHPMPSSYIDTSGSKVDVDESDTSYFIQKVQTVIEANARDLIPPTQMNYLSLEGKISNVLLEPTANGFIVSVMGDRSTGYVKNQSGETVLFNWDTFNQIASTIPNAPSRSGRSLGFLHQRGGYTKDLWLKAIRDSSNFDKPDPKTGSVAWLDVGAFEHLLDRKQNEIRDDLVRMFQEHEQNGIKK